MIDKAKIEALIKQHEEGLENAKANYFRIEGALATLRQILKDIETEDAEDDSQVG